MIKINDERSSIVEETSRLQNATLYESEIVVEGSRKIDLCISAKQEDTSISVAIVDGNTRYIIVGSVLIPHESMLPLFKNKIVNSKSIIIRSQKPAIVWLESVKI